MKLSKTQEEVVCLMREGWELRRSPYSTYWLQNTDVPFKQTKTVYGPTFRSLLKNGVIVMHGRQDYVTTYRLKESLT